MQRHEFFNLYLHSTAELENVLKLELCERTTLHEWPLSCVELLTSTKGKRWIYKSQFGPSVEPAFYTRAKSLLIPKAEILHVSALGHSNMLLDFIDAPLLEEAIVSDSDVATMSEAIAKSISDIKGQLPYYLDLSSKQKWLAFIKELIVDLKILKSQEINHDVIEHIEYWAFSKVVLAVFSGEISYVHHDLSGTNIFITSEGYKVIDWQRPILAPKALDLAILVESLARNPLEYVDEGIVWMMYLLRIHWFKECSLQWFPEGKQGYEKAILDLNKQLGEAL